MISRRRFLQASTVAAGASLAAESVRPLMAAERSSLHPSIAKLKSMKDLAKPITREEFLARQENARQRMQSSGVDSILLMEGTSLGYFTGIHWWGGERLFAMILPIKGAPYYVCPSFEEGRAREQIAATSTEAADVRTWHEAESPYELVAQGLHDRGISTAT